MGDGGLRLESVASSAAPALVPRGAAGAACEGLGSGVRRDGRRAWGRCGCPKPSGRARRAKPWGAVAFLLPDLLVPAPRGEGRKEGERPCSARRGANLLTLLGRSRPTLLGKEIAGLPLLTPPRTHSPPHPGRMDAELFANGLNPSSPDEAAGREWEPRRQARTSIAARQNPQVHRGAAAQGGSKLPPRPPLPRGAPSGGRDGGGRRVLSQSKGRAGLRGRGGARNAMQPGGGRLLPRQAPNAEV